MKKFLKLPYLPIFLGPLILFSPLIFGGKALFWGTPSLQFVPWWDRAWTSIQSGVLPLWNPLSGMGAPLLANYQSALFYPPHWIYFLLHMLGGTVLMAWGQALMVMLHLVWAGAGMAFLLRHLGKNALSQTLGGLSFSLSSYLVARAGFLSINAAAAWIPWIMAFSMLVTKTPTLTGFLKLCLVLSMQLLAGHAQTAYYTLILTGLWVGYWAWQESQHSEWIPTSWEIMKGWGRYLGSTAAALGLSAIQLLPTLEYFLQSQRANAADYPFVVTYSFWPWRLLTLLAPDLFGNPRLGNYWGYANYWEDAIYIGLLPLLLAGGMIISALYKQIQEMFRPEAGSAEEEHKLTVFLVMVMIFALIVALGKNTPVFPWLYRHIPTFDLFQAPTRITIWLVYALSLLAGLQADHWRRPRGRGLYWTRLATAGAAAVTIGAGLTWFLLDSVKFTFVRAAALAGVWGVGAGALSLTAPEVIGERTVPNWWKWAAALWVMLDLIVAGWGLNPGIDASFYQELSPQIQREERLYLPEEEEYELKFDHFLQFGTFQPGLDWMDMRRSSLPNLNLLEGTSMVNNFDPLVPGRYQTWMDALQKAGKHRTQDVLHVMGVGSVGEIHSPGKVIYNTLPQKGEHFHWYSCATFGASPEQALQTVMERGTRPPDRLVLEAQRRRTDQACGASHARIRVQKNSPNQVELSVTASQKGWLLRSSVWYPGWRVTIDGDRARLYQAQYLFQAVEIPVGEHEVVFSYRPNSFFIGAGISVLSSLVVGILSLRSMGNRAESEE